MGMMNPKLRKKVYSQSKKCAYCGEELEFKNMQVDHKISKANKGTDEMSNLISSCRLCNWHKSDFTVDKFREELLLKIDRLRKQSNIRLLEKYGIIKFSDEPIVFDFEEEKKMANTKEIELAIADLREISRKAVKAYIDPLSEKILRLEEKRIKSIIDNKEYITDLSEFKDKDIFSLTAINKDGKEVYLPIDELIKISEDGHLALSSFGGGLVDWSDEDNCYMYTYYQTTKKMDILGFIDICLES